MSKKQSVKWNLPEKSSHVNKDDSPRTPRSTRSHGESQSEGLVYSDTFEDPSQIQVYSDSFVSESYSDTFINSSSAANSEKPRVLKDESIITDIIQTVISCDSSYIADDTNLETAKYVETEALETVIEVDSYSDDFITAAADTRFSETLKTALDTEFADSVLDTAYDISDTHPPDSYTYTDTFEESGRTRADSEYDTDTDSFTETQTERSYTYTKTYSSGDRTKTTSEPSQAGKTWYEDESLDRSFVAPDHDCKSMTDDEGGDNTYNDEYSYTFEPTEVSSQVYLVDPEQIRKEEELVRKTQRAEIMFIQKFVDRLKHDANDKRERLETLSPEPEIESEDEYLRHYCKKRIQQMKKRKHLKTDEISNDTEDRPHPLLVNKPRPFVDDTPLPLSDYGIPDTVLERAKLVNIMSAMKKASEEKIHGPRKCPECREEKLRMDTEDAERKFVLSRAKTLENKMMDARVEDHILKMNSISLIAELARTLPMASEKPEKILDQLLEPLLGKNVMR